MNACSLATLVAATAGGTLTAAAPSAQAGSRVYISVASHPVYMAPAPVIVPQPVYVPPPPLIVHRPVYVALPPMIVRDPTVAYRPYAYAVGYHTHHHAHHGFGFHFGYYRH